MGQTIDGRYSILKKIGEGGMGAVYLAEDLRLRRKVAVKRLVFQGKPANEEMFHKRFEREALAMASFQHPNIVSVFDYGQDDQGVYLVIAYMLGGSLADRMRKHRHTVEEAINILIPLAAALQAIHQRDRVHRDIKPANILFDEYGNPKLADFGVVKLLETEESRNLTATGAAIGTPAYMAPELIGGEASPATDQYALGVVLYELVTGKKPFQGRTPMETLTMQKYEPLPDPRSFNPELPGWICGVMQTALAKESVNRYADVQAFAEVLRVGELKEEETAVVHRVLLEDEIIPPIGAVEQDEDETAAVVSKPNSHSNDPRTMKPEPHVSKRPKKAFPIWSVYAGIAIILVGLVIGFWGKIFGGGKIEETPVVEDASVDQEVVMEATIPQTPSETTSSDGQKSNFYVGLVTDGGDITDHAFNQAAWEGLQQASETYGIRVEYSESQSSDDYAANIDAFAEAGVDLMVTTSYLMTEVTAAAAERHPEILFIGIDQYQEAGFDNMTSLMFEEWQGGFQAGVLAALHTQTYVVGGVFATDLIPPVVAFAEGFVDGVTSTNNVVTVTVAYHPGDVGESFLDPEWGAAAAREMIEAGADVIFAAGAQTANGALIETANHDQTWCIGVDTDQWETLPEAHGCLVSSAVREIADNLFDMIGLALSGSLPNGNYYGTFTMAPYHDFEDQVSEEVRMELTAVYGSLAAGEIQYEDFHTSEPQGDLGIGSTMTRDKDGMPMMYVPGGEFTMGPNVKDGIKIAEHQEDADQYWIDKFEVTNKQYELCVLDDGCTMPSQEKSFSRDAYFGNAEFADYPVLYINRTQALQYCEWAGGSLPTEVQWEKAARGTEGLPHPWGDQSPTCELENFDQCVGDTSPVDSFPGGASPYGVYHMGGNVHEWILDQAHIESDGVKYDLPYTKGGSWESPAELLDFEILELTHQSFYWNADTGFRCVYPAVNP